MCSLACLRKPFNLIRWDIQRPYKCRLEPEDIQVSKNKDLHKLVTYHVKSTVNALHDKACEFVGSFTTASGLVSHILINYSLIFDKCFH